MRKKLDLAEMDEMSEDAKWFVNRPSLRAFRKQSLWMYIEELI